MEKTRLRKQMIAVIFGVIFMVSLINQSIIVMAESAPAKSNGYIAPDLIISDMTGLKEFSQSVADGNTYEGKLVRLTADIGTTGTAVTSFTPIKSFAGTFDGAGHTIAGIQVIESDKLGKGLFREITANGIVKNLTISNSVFVSSSKSNYSNMGAVVAVNNGQISNCKVINSEITSAGSYHTGGIVGLNNGNVYNCANKETVIEVDRTSGTTGVFYGTGGVVGGNTGNIVNCLSTGIVMEKYNSSPDQPGTGGIVGNSKADSRIENCANIGNISTNGQYAGGIAGRCQGATIQNCYNVGIVTNSKSSERAGGIVGGCNSSVLTNCYYASDTADQDIASSDSAVVKRNIRIMSRSDMQTAEFVNSMNTDNGANETWFPWESRADLAYPQHRIAYGVSWNGSSYGVITCDTDFTYAGKKVSFEVEPAEYYKISKVSAKTAAGVEQEITGADGAYSFVMPAEWVIIDASFKYSKPIDKCNVTLSAESVSYDGKEKEPEVTVKDGMITLEKGTDYTVEYSDNVELGQGIVTINGLGSYTGKVDLPFDIVMGTLVVKEKSNDIEWKLDSAGNLTISGTGNWETVKDSDDETCPPWYAYRDDIKKVKVKLTGTTNASYMFYKCENIEEIDFSEFDTSLVTDMSWMFPFCKKLTKLDLSNFVTDKVTTMSNMFCYCYDLTELDISSFNTSNVTNMEAMFAGLNIDLDLRGFNTGKVTTFNSMFGYGTMESINLGGLDTGKVTNMTCMFYECPNLKSINMTGFNTKNVTNMSYMFYNCKALEEIDLSGFNAESVSNVEKMFDGCEALNIINTPLNVKVSCSLPGTFYTEELETDYFVDALPKNQSKSVLLTRGDTDGTTPVGSVKIVSVTPNYYESFGESVTFTAKVNYKLSGCKKGIVYLGFNTESAHFYEMYDNKIVDEGEGTVTLSATVEPVDWTTGPHMAMQGVEMAEYGFSDFVKDFKLYVNIAKYPHGSSFTPLAIEEMALSHGKPKVLNSISATKKQIIMQREALSIQMI